MKIYTKDDFFMQTGSLAFMLKMITSLEQFKLYFMPIHNTVSPIEGIK